MLISKSKEVSVFIFIFVITSRHNKITNKRYREMVVILGTRNNGFICIWISEFRTLIPYLSSNRINSRKFSRIDVDSTTFIRTSSSLTRKSLLSVTLHTFVYTQKMLNQRGAWKNHESRNPIERDKSKAITTPNALCHLNINAMLFLWIFVHLFAFSVSNKFFQSVNGLCSGVDVMDF